MKIVLIGAGRLACNLGHALLHAGHNILQVYSRTLVSARQLADKIGAIPVTDIANIRCDADVYIFSIKDSVLADLIPLICKNIRHAIFLHTAGSVSIDVFKCNATHYGVLYPLQTFTKNRILDFKTIPCFLEYNDDITRSVLVDLSQSISNNIRFVNSEERKYVHLAAVFACNFVNHCYTIASDILSRHNMPFELLLPLIDETARKVHEIDPIDSQTGPAVRFDENIINKQIKMLEYNPILKDIYNLMSTSIHRKTIEND